ncbi:MAG TPA: ABC transporter ATP-binding protein, partial [Actinophytocola sp.]|uniref:ABC transporter ATP-binding protein n=1 Tax=Actinophytocola sp. TaxID=1872138 RepID=UPI002DDD636F
VLTLRGIHAGYGGGDVLRGLDLSVEAGSVTCVLGPNGAGKSTVLRVISGLLRARRGEILLGGARIDRLSPPEILARGVAQVPQTGALFPRMSVRENLLMGGYLIRRQRLLLAQRYDAVAELVPLVRERPGVAAGNLSGGQRRLLEIGRSLMLDPAVVLLDEPSLGLDPRGLTAVAELIRGMRERGKTVLLVEQNVRLGLSLSSHGVVMEGGRVRLHGPAKDIVDHPEIATLYLGALASSSS